MNPSELASARVIEATLGSHGSYRKIEDGFYLIKQGSTYVMINVVPWGGDRSLVRCVAQLVRGVSMNEKLTTELLSLNAHLRFGAFGYDPVGNVILFLHSILGGDTLDPAELLATVTDVALISDEYDDKIIAQYGGETMRELVERAAIERLLAGDPDHFNFGNA